MIYLVAALGVFFGVFIIYANVLYWRELKKMPPDEYRMFKEEEREDLRTW